MKNTKTNGAAKAAKTTTKDAALLDSLQCMADYWKKGGRGFPLWKLKLPTALVRKMRPVVKRICDRFKLTPSQGRGVFLELGFRRLCGKDLPSSRSKE